MTASPPILSSEDLQLRSPAGLESAPPMPHWNLIEKIAVFHASDSLRDDPSRPLQSGSSDEL